MSCKLSLWTEEPTTNFTFYLKQSAICRAHARTFFGTWLPLFFRTKTTMHVWEDCLGQHSTVKSFLLVLVPNSYTATIYDT